MEYAHEAANEAGKGIEGLKEKLDEDVEALGKFTEGWQGPSWVSSVSVRKGFRVSENVAGEAQCLGTT
jgi:hypothetical protein